MKILFGMALLLALTGMVRAEGCCDRQCGLTEWQARELAKMDEARCEARRPRHEEYQHDERGCRR